MPPKAADCVHFALVDVLRERIRDPVSDETTQNKTQNDFTRLADRERDVAAAFKRGRSFLNARASDIVPLTAVNPAFPSSSTSEGKGTAQTFIASTIASSTILTVNSSVIRMLCPVSLNFMSA